MTRVCFIIFTIIVYANNCEPCETEEDTTKILSEKYAAVSSAYFLLSSKYSVLSEAYEKYSEDEKCANFYQTFLPYTEEKFINEAVLEDLSYCDANPVFTGRMAVFFSTKSPLMYVEKILNRFELTLDDPETCSFQQLKHTDPSSEEMMIVYMKKRGKFEPSMCERFIAFLDALALSPEDSITDPDLRDWKIWLTCVMDEIDSPFPLIAQRILGALHWANTFHHDVGKFIPQDNEFDVGYYLGKCFATFITNSRRYVTEPCAPPACQYLEEFPNAKMIVTKPKYDGYLAALEKAAIKAKSRLLHMSKTTTQNPEQEPKK